MTTHHLHTSTAPRPAGAYSQAVVANGFLYTAGMGPHDPVTGQVVGEMIAEQTRQVLRNLAALLAEQGLDFSHVVKVTTHLAELDRDFHDYNAVYEEHLSRPFPVRTTVGSKLAGILVEIDLVAALPSS
ncbi:RidA family protein [Nonomuraea sp. H19]|uniref:RidA family protein n=1 Tax=Nonomuraea sp. H19 TaxID=3452206 RepID=UPI003F88A755